MRDTVRSGECAASRSIAGNAFSIQGVGHGPPGANRFCMSTHRWTAFGPGDVSADPIMHLSGGYSR